MKYLKQPGMTLVSAGFLAVLGVPKDKIIPNVKNGESVTADFEALKKETEPPKRYTDATLLNAMINCGKTLEDEELRRLMAGKPGERPLGLGRPSSQASIVQTLEDRPIHRKERQDNHSNYKRNKFDCMFSCSRTKIGRYDSAMGKTA